MTIRARLLSGFLLALLSAVLSGWDYHLTEQHANAGWLFFAVAAGAAASGGVSTRHSVTPFIGILGSALATIALIILSFLAPPVPFGVQAAGWFAIGFAAGLINPERVGILAFQGVYFTAGCLTSAVVLAAVMHLGYVLHLLAMLAIIPASFGLLALIPEKPIAQDREPVREFSTAGALIFGALLLLQSGSEWTVAGWLPLFLTHRLGISPERALWMLALYWTCLLLGRAAQLFLLAHVRHTRILFSSAAAALLGCVLLVSTDNVPGAIASIVLLGAGFAAVYPLLAEKMGSRYPQSGSQVTSRIFYLALSGGLFFPWFAGLLAQSVSLTAIVAIPAVGIISVSALLLVLWLESKVTGR